MYEVREVRALQPLGQWGAPQQYMSWWRGKARGQVSVQAGGPPRVKLAKVSGV